MPPPPACGDFNSHPELSAWRSLRMSVIQIFIMCVHIGNYSPSIYQVWSS